MESNATHASETDSHVSSQPNVGKQKTKRAHRGPSSKRVDKQAVTDASSVGQEDSPTSSSPVVLIAKTKKARPPADASAPKRACTAFLLFSKDERARVKAEHPTASNAEIARHLGDKWKAADADTKAKYNGLYAESKARADEERRVYDEAMLGDASRACTIESAVESPLTVPILQAVAKAKNVDMGRSSSFIVVSNPEGTSLKCSWKSVLDASMNIAC